MGMREIRKWLRQAEEDLKAARDSLKDEHYD
ncbi:MAG: HEPN domain-containing protein [Canidatus Methanoxibalbensis ujae]|nr:HEPN domain-containing protein [Candidatus Methanoxibalbensis ujae]